MKIAIQAAFALADGKHSTIWELAQHFFRHLAKLERDNEYLVFSYGFWNHSKLKSRLIFPQAPNFSSYVPLLPRRVAHWAEDRLGCDIRGFLLRRQGANLLHIFEQIDPAPPSFPSLVTFLDLIPEIFPHWSTGEIRSAMRLNAQRGRHFTAISESTKRDMGHLYGIASDRVTVIPPGIDFDTYRPLETAALEMVRRRFSLPKIFLFSTGANLPRKNLESLLAAFPAWRKVEPGLGLVLAGHKSAYRESLERQVRDERLNGVLFIGEPSASELAALYNLARIFVYPSLYEGFGMPIAEAMACGCPVVASRVSSIPEVVGPAGILFSLDRPDELVDAVTALLRQPERRAALASHGREWAKRFSWDDNVRRTLELYHRLCGGSPSQIGFPNPPPPPQ